MTQNIEPNPVSWVLPVRDEIGISFGRMSCISAVAALIDVGAFLGVGTLTPLTVRAKVFNPFLSAKIGDMSTPGSDTRLRQWIDAPEAFTVDLGGGTAPPGEWSGHLVAIAPHPSKQELKLVLDPTLEQVNQPDQGINLSPLVLPVNMRHLQGDGEFRKQVANCEIMYKAFPAELFFERTQLWTDRRLRLAVRDRVLARLKL